MLKSSLANIAEYPSAFRIYEEETGKVMELAVSNCFISNLLSQGFEIAHSEAEKRITIRDNGPCCGL